MRKRPPVFAAAMAVAALLAVLFGGVAARTVHVFTRLERAEASPPRAAPAGTRRPTGAACC